MNTHALQLKNMLTELIEETATHASNYIISNKQYMTRKRKWGPATLIRFILSSGSNSLGYEIGEFFEYKEDFPSVSSFVQQRQKLHYSAFQTIFNQFNIRNNRKPMLFKDYRILSVDGSDLSLPYNPKEENVYGQNHMSLLHLNALYDVINKQFLDVEVQRALQENECGAACELIDRIPETYPIILLADRGFENYNLFAHVEERIFDYVVRMRDSDNSCIVSKMKLPDADEYDVTKRIVITRHTTGPAAIMPSVYKVINNKTRFDYIENTKSPDYEMYIRFVRFRLNDDNYEILATSLTEENFSAKELKELYALRWGIETGFRELKYVLGLSAFHSKKENSILQEVFARLIMYNFSMIITLEVPIKEKDRRYQLQVNFTQATKICLNFFKYRGKEPPYDIEATIQRFLLPIRPNRKRQRESVSTTVVSFNYRLA